MLLNALYIPIATNKCGVLLEKQIILIVSEAENLEITSCSRLERAGQDNWLLDPPSLPCHTFPYAHTVRGLGLQWCTGSEVEATAALAILT